MRSLRQSCASLKTPSRKLAVVAHAHAGPRLGHARHAPHIAAFVATAVITGMGFSSPAMAEKVGEFAGSGFLFKVGKYRSYARGPLGHARHDVRYPLASAIRAPLIHAFAGQYRGSSNR